MAEAEDGNIQNMVDKAVAEAQASIDDLKKVTDEAGKPQDQSADADAAGRTGSAEAAQTQAQAKGGQPIQVPDLTESGVVPTQVAYREPANGIELLSDVDVHVTIELGRTRMLVEDVLALASGSVVELDKLAGDPVDVFVNGRLVARGEVLVLNDNFCIRISEIVANLEEQAQAAAGEQEQQDQQEADPKEAQEQQAGVIST